MSKLSRRSLVTGAAALPVLAVPAVAIAATAELDPIFALIEAHRAVNAEFIKAVAAADVLDHPQEAQLQAMRNQASHRERDHMWDLIWTRPTTMSGLAALLAYRRVNEGPAWFDDEWLMVCDWNIEALVCAFAGLPEPPMSKVVAELADQELEDGQS
jgi:hypothetical protein